MKVVIKLLEAIGYVSLKLNSVCVSVSEKEREGERERCLRMNERGRENMNERQ